MSFSNAKPTSAATLTGELVDFAKRCSWHELPAEARHCAIRHLLDTVGTMIAGASGHVACSAERMLANVHPAGSVPVPGRSRRADMLDGAFLAATAGHGIELDDGYRQGSVHPGVCIVPAALYAAYGRGKSGSSLLEAVVAGYEIMLSVALLCHPDLRRKGFHPTGVTGVLGAAAAAARLFDFEPQQIENAFGIAASSAAGLFAFINGGTDIKRLHAGHAAREGLQAVLLTCQGILGPPRVLESPDGFLQSFGKQGGALYGISLPPAAEYRITDCYIKPYACCRHLQPAAEALIGLLDQHGIDEAAIREVRVETYAIAAAHSATPWDEYASAQLSFPYVMALSMRYRGIKLGYFEDTVRNDPGLGGLCARVRVQVAGDLDQQYPHRRPARVTVSTDAGTYTRTALEALGCRDMPLTDAQLGEKFLELTEPALGAGRARPLLEQLWTIAQFDDVSPVIDSMALAACS